LFQFKIVFCSILNQWNIRGGGISWGWNCSCGAVVISFNVGHMVFVVVVVIIGVGGVDIGGAVIGSMNGGVGAGASVVVAYNRESMTGGSGGDMHVHGVKHSGVVNIIGIIVKFEIGIVVAVIGRIVVNI